MSDIKQVIVMRTDLNMRKGKMIAQGSHAAMMFLTKRLQDLDGDRNVVDRSFGLSLTPANARRLLRFQEVSWVKGNFKKITVGVKSEAHLLEILEAARTAGLEVHLVTDNGLTEFKGVPTKTCLAIGPAEAVNIDPITGNLPLL